MKFFLSIKIFNKPINHFKPKIWIQHKILNKSMWSYDFFNLSYDNSWLFYINCFSTYRNAFFRIVFIIKKPCYFNRVCFKLYKSLFLLENIFYLYKLWKILVIFDIKICFHCNWNQYIETNQKINIFKSNSLQKLKKLPFFQHNQRC